MLRKLGIVSVIFASGCAPMGRASIVRFDDPTRPNAPSNLKRGGVVRYAQGQPSQDAAYAKMREACGGAYKAVKTERVSLGREYYQDAFGGGADESYATETTFECE